MPPGPQSNAQNALYLEIFKTPPPWSTSFQISPFLHDKKKKWCCLSWFADWRILTSERVSDKGVQTGSVCTFTLRTKTDERLGKISLPRPIQHSRIWAQGSAHEENYSSHQTWHRADQESIVSMWTSAEVDLTAVCSCVSLSSVEYDFRQQEKLFLEVLNRSANVDHAHHLNFRLLRRAILKKVTKSKVKSKKLCKTLFKWLPGKIQHVQTSPTQCDV